jgi:hypothetical protein
MASVPNSPLNWALVVAIAFILLGCYLCFTHVALSLWVDTCLDLGGSFDYETELCDFSRTHAYEPRSAYALWGLACLTAGIGIVAWVRKQKKRNAV